MLIDQDDTNVLAFFCEAVECVRNRRLLRLLIDYEEVSLSIRRLCDMSHTCEE